MKLSAWISLLIIAVIGPSCSTVPLAEKAEVQTLFGEMKAHRYRLPNGLKVVLVEDRSSPTFAYQTWFRVGSRNEEVGKTGLAHLFEHMMFRQTKNLKEGEFDRLLEEAGVEGQNAFTSMDYTAYVQELPSDRLDLIVRLESERMVNLIVNDASFKTETEVVQNERRMSKENNPAGMMFQELFALMFRVHPYRWPVIGYEEDLAAMTSADALEFYNRFYAPDRATIVIVGDIRPKQALKLIHQHYGSIQNRSIQDVPLPVEPPQTSIRRKKLSLTLPTEKLMITFRAPEFSSADTPTLELIQSILSFGAGSRLNRALVETGIATSVGAGAYGTIDPSMFIFSLNLQKGARSPRAESVILRELERLKKESVPEREIERARNLYRFHHFDSLGSNQEKARFIGQHETVSEHFKSGVQLLNRVMEVSSSDIMRVAKKYFNPNHRTVVTGVPQ